MNRWLRRLAYLLIILLWLGIMLFPIVAFRLAMNGQFQIRDTRVFMVQERGTSGIGIETIKPASNDPVCSQTRIRYLLWDGEGENAQVCLCNDGSERVPERWACLSP